MRHRVKTRNLSRRRGHRRALARNLVGALIRHERIETTVAKAKVHRPFAEKLVTLAKEKTLANYRRALQILAGDKEAVAKLFEVLGPRFKDRPGGYTRILKLETPRLGDKAPVAIFEFVERSSEAFAADTEEEPPAAE